MRTLLHASDNGDLDLAARCLDLDGVPQGLRDELGPILAYKLKFVLDRIGRVAVEELPSEADGPRYHYYRGPLGRIDLVRRARERLGKATGSSHAKPWPGSSRCFGPWRIGRSTRPCLGSTRSRRSLRFGWSPRSGSAVSCPLAPWPRAGARPLPVGGPGDRPGGFRRRLLDWPQDDRAAGVLRPAVGGFNLERSLVAEKLRPLSFQLGLFCLYHLLRLLDLPAAVVSATIPAVKVIWIGLLGWTAFRLIDLGMILYTRSERLHDRRSLSDMIVPTAANGMKLAVLLVAASCQVYLVGSRETLTQLLAGLGLVGLAASLAAQDTLKNFFGTLLLIGEHPFRIGEHVAVQNVEGTVESVGFRSTRLRTFEDSLLTIPNSVMASALIDNRGAGPRAASGPPLDWPTAHRSTSSSHSATRCGRSPPASLGLSPTRSRFTSAA